MARRRPRLKTVANDFAPRVAESLGLGVAQVRATLALFAAGGTVPFIARYRKEATGNLDEVQIRDVEARHASIAELEARRQLVLASITDQNKLSPELERRLRACSSRAELEDLYLPYRPKRHSRAQMARDRGLLPLAERLLAQPLGELAATAAAAHVGGDGQVADVTAALAGARDIVAERVVENAELRAWSRQYVQKTAILTALPSPAAADQRTPYEQYYAFRGTLTGLPSHRFLAIRRGESAGLLRVALEVDAAPILARLQQAHPPISASDYAPHLQAALEDGLRRLLLPAVETDVRVMAKQQADAEAVAVFAVNLRALLLAAPLGGRAVLGIDPGLRSGCKCVALDGTGKFLSHVTLYIGQSAAAAEKARADLLRLCQAHAPECIVIGNGTGGREAEAFVRASLQAQALELPVVAVSEAGASVYSASDAARAEFPQLDLTLRGAISIGRRLQDPLAELVKIEPRAIGVGQYQHDVHQPLLQRRLQEVVVSCVHHVGVQLNTASAALLSQVAGLGPALSQKIVAYREAHGAFASRAALHAVPGLGPRAFEQAAGFLRVVGGSEPLDASAVHPERYALVRRMATDLGVAVQGLLGNDLAANLDLDAYVDAAVGEPTLRDIMAELQRPGRDPRADFAPARFRADVQALTDLSVGMALEGVVTNVTAFGAFVDIGVHQDGLVHISELADRFIREPSEVVQVGQRLQVRVLAIDLERRRVALSARRPAASAAPRAAADRQPRTAGGASRPELPPTARHDRRGQLGRDAAGGRGSRPPAPAFVNNPFAKLKPV